MAIKKGSRRLSRLDAFSHREGILFLLHPKDVLFRMIRKRKEADAFL